MRASFLKAFIFFLTMGLASFSCKKAESFHANGIKILSGKKKEKIVISTFALGGGSQAKLDNFTAGEVENYPDKLFYFLSNSSDKVFIEIDENFEANKGIILYVKGNELAYSATSYTIAEKGDNLEVSAKIKRDNDSKDIKVLIQSSHLGSGNSTYSVNNNEATLNGSLGSFTYNQILDINEFHPTVDKIVLGEIDGSVNDDINVLTGRLIREAGYTTVVKATSKIYSGGVDLYCSGKQREWSEGAEVGVHSWCCYEGKTADKLPENSPGHKAQLSYFKEMLGDLDGPAFYFFTLKSAPFDGIHVMNKAELIKYKLIKE